MAVAAAIATSTEAAVQRRQRGGSFVAAFDEGSLVGVTASTTPAVEALWSRSGIASRYEAFPLS